MLYASQRCGLQALRRFHKRNCAAIMKRKPRVYIEVRCSFLIYGLLSTVCQKLFYWLALIHVRRSVRKNVDDVPVLHRAFPRCLTHQKSLGSCYHFSHIGEGGTVLLRVHACENIMILTSREQRGSLIPQEEHSSMEHTSSILAYNICHSIQFGHYSLTIQT